MKMFQVFLATASMALLSACSHGEHVDYRALLTPDNQFNDQKFDEAKRKCAAVSTSEQPFNAWCNAKRKAANCAMKKICPDS